MVDVGDEQVHPAVSVEVGRVQAHSRARPAFGAVSHPRRGPDLLEAPVAAIREQEVGHCIVGDEQIHATVVIDVGSNHAPSLARKIANAGGLAYVGKSPVAIVMKEPAGHGFVEMRDAVATLGILTGMAILALGLVEIYEPAHEEVEPAIIVVDEPDGA